MAEARLINDQSGTRGPLMTLEGAMRDAVRANLDLMAQGIEIDASYEDVKVSRGNWLPQAGADADFLINDPAVSTSFEQAERQFTWGISGSQLLYSPGSHATLRFRRDTYWSTEHDYMAARLDTMLEAGEAYLNVLRAKNTERVNRDNLKLTRKNLSLAETRNAIGVAGREEVFRWQTQNCGKPFQRHWRECPSQPKGDRPQSNPQPALGGFISRSPARGRARGDAGKRPTAREIPRRPVVI